MIRDELTDLEWEAFVFMLDAFVAEGWIEEPYPGEYYSLFEKLGYDPTAERYQWECPNCNAITGGAEPFPCPSKCTECGASMEEK